MLIDGEFQCFTLEDVEREYKIAGETAIPVGSYPVDVTYSPRFKHLMPLILDVPNFSGVRIHWGNTPDDTEGCILVGKTRGTDFIGKSREAYALIFPQILAAVDAGQPVSIHIRDA